MTTLQNYALCLVLLIFLVQMQTAPLRGAVCVTRECGYLPRPKYSTGENNMAGKPMCRSTADFVALFWSRVKVGAESECWEWQHSMFTNGYGCIQLRPGENVLAHRLSYMMTTGQNLERKQLVCHTCDNRKCVNPSHMFIGSHRDNALDMIAKGRDVKPLNFRLGTCKRGHPRTPENVRYRKCGRLVICKVCQDMAYERRKAA